MNKKAVKPATYDESELRDSGSDAVPILSNGIGNRISEAARLLGTRTNAYVAMAVSSATLQRYIKEEVSPPFEAIARLCLAAGVRMEWLATGDGAMKVDAALAASDSDSQPLRRDDLKMALQLAAEALEGKVLPPDKYAQVVILIYELLEEGLPEAKVLRFARVTVA